MVDGTATDFVTQLDVARRAGYREAMWAVQGAVEGQKSVGAALDAVAALAKGT